jgi:DNA-binding response OmpR family regulator
MKERALQVLLVEDNAGDVRLLREMFSKERADSFELTHLVRMGDAEVHLAKGGVDIVLLDMGLPDGHGLETVRRTHAAAPGVPNRKQLRCMTGGPHNSSASVRA